MNKEGSDCFYLDKPLPSTAVTAWISVTLFLSSREEGVKVWYWTEWRGGVVDKVNLRLGASSGEKTSGESWAWDGFLHRPAIRTPRGRSHFILMSFSFIRPGGWDDWGCPGQLSEKDLIEERSNEEEGYTVIYTQRKNQKIWHLDGPGTSCGSKVVQLNIYCSFLTCKLLGNLLMALQQKSLFLLEILCFRDVGDHG